MKNEKPYVKKILDAHKRGLYNKAIAREVGICGNVVAREIKNAGLVPNKFNTNTVHASVIPKTGRFAHIK